MAAGRPGQLPVTCLGWHRVGSGASHHLGLADQPAEPGAALIAPIASSIERGEQFFTFTDTPMCAPGGSCGSCVFAATALPASVPSGPAWPWANMVAPACNRPGLACGITTSVPPEVVTGTRVPLDVTRVKPPVPASATVPWTGTKPGGFTALNGCPTVTIAAVIVPSDLEPRTMTDAPSVMSPSSAPDMDTNVVAVVVTVTSWPLAVLMTRLLPFTCSSVPSACWSWEHPVTAVRVVCVPPPPKCTCTTPTVEPIATRRTSAAATLPTASKPCRTGRGSTCRLVLRGRAGWAVS